MSMKQAYQQLITSKKLSFDAAQLTAVNTLADLTVQVKEQQVVLANPLNKWRRQNKVKGIYFHGRVGRGKTMLMDLFFQHLAIPKKQRIHFHRFMESIHQQLFDLPNCSGKIDNPLKYIAKIWREKVDVLCFDEFFVSDIGDAMLIGGLLDALLQQGIILVATSNCQPEELYRNGLQRERFLPTIDLINHHCHIISVNGDVDHRLAIFKEHKQLLLTDQSQESPPVYRDYVFPLDTYPLFLKERFQQICLKHHMNQWHHNGKIGVNHREIEFIGKKDNVIWFDFFALCSGPRSQRDYISIADIFSTVLISNVPQFSGKLIPAVFSGVEDSYQRSGVLMGDLRQLDDEARRFIALVDEFYDRKVQLIISAEVDILDLYQGRQLKFEFDRCQSRLFEMQTIDY